MEMNNHIDKCCKSLFGHANWSYIDNLTQREQQQAIATETVVVFFANPNNSANGHNQLNPKVRRKLQTWYAKHMNELDIWKPRDTFQMCLTGFRGACQMTDKELIEAYTEYADQCSIPKKERII